MSDKKQDHDYELVKPTVMRRRKKKGYVIEGLVNQCSPLDTLTSENCSEPTTENFKDTSPPKEKKAKTITLRSFYDHYGEKKFYKPESPRRNFGHGASAPGLRGTY